MSKSMHVPSPTDRLLRLDDSRGVKRRRRDGLFLAKFMNSNKKPNVLGKIQIAVVLLAFVAAATIGYAETPATDLPVTRVYVSPNGNDAHSGKLAKASAGGTDGPLASLAAARDAVRKLKTGGRLPGPVKVIVAGGTG